MSAESNDRLAKIVAGLTGEGHVVREALADAAAHWEECAPHLVDLIDRSAASPEPKAKGDSPIFLIVLLCAQMGDTSAFQPIMRLLACEPKLVDRLLGDVITENLGKVVAAVFNGDVGLLHRSIFDAAIDEYVRDSLLEALTRLTRQGRIPREDTVGFLARCDAEMQPRVTNHAWYGWSEAIAVLGVEQLKDAVAQAFRDERIDPDFCDYKDFEQDLAATLAGGLPHLWKDAPFSTVIDEVGWWPGLRERSARDEVQAVAGRLGTKVDPLRKVGRNDPCPCGSSKKYKKCCLAA